MVNEVGVAVAGGQGVGRALIHEEARSGGAAVWLVEEPARRHAILNVIQAPALEIDTIGQRPAHSRPQTALPLISNAFISAGLGVNRRLELVGEIILDQRQHARHCRRRHARASLITVISRPSWSFIPSSTASTSPTSFVTRTSTVDVNIDRSRWWDCPRRSKSRHSFGATESCNYRRRAEWKPCRWRW